MLGKSVIYFVFAGVLCFAASSCETVEEALSSISLPGSQSKDYTQTGVSFGTHPQFRTMCAITYAKGYVSNE